MLLFSVTTCSGDQFRCIDGICLSIDKRCNGIPDCRNGEDEHQCGKLTRFFPLFEAYIYLIEFYTVKHTNYQCDFNDVDFKRVQIIRFLYYSLYRLR